MDDIDLFHLFSELKDWANHHNIIYKIKPFKMGIKFILPNNDNYFLFCLTWNPERQYNFKIIEPMKIDKT